MSEKSAAVHLKNDTRKGRGGGHASPRGPSAALRVRGAVDKKLSLLEKKEIKWSAVGCGKLPSCFVGRGPCTDGPCDVISMSMCDVVVHERRAPERELSVCGNRNCESLQEQSKKWWYALAWKEEIKVEKRSTAEGEASPL